MSSLYIWEQSVHMLATWKKNLDALGWIGSAACASEGQDRSANLLAALQDKHELDSEASGLQRTQTLLLKSGFQLA